MQITSTHVFFYRGDAPPSNHFVTKSQPFSGNVAWICMLHVLARRKADNPRLLDFARYHNIAERVIREHSFVSGEQFIMAVKSMYFDHRHWKQAGNDTTSNDDLAKIVKGVLTNLNKEKHPTLWKTRLGAILRSQSAKQAKAHAGPKSEFGEMKDFDHETWMLLGVAASAGVVVARCLADKDFLKFMKAYSLHTFVEATPEKNEWGVGHKWDSDNILSGEKWKGEKVNALGDAYELAKCMLSRIYEDWEVPDDDSEFGI
jgi:predicted NAD-dependent protein-ADP-ribosyltransferase YbiA (DUF1768 family)